MALKVRLQSYKYSTSKGDTTNQHAWIKTVDLLYEFGEV